MTGNGGTVAAGTSGAAGNSVGTPGNAGSAGMAGFAGSIAGGATSTSIGGTGGVGATATSGGSIATGGAPGTGGVPPVVRSIVTGLYHSCAMYDDGTVKCWGRNVFGQLGNAGTVDHSPTPVSVSNMTDAKAITSGDDHTCALLRDNTVKCWGANTNGQLGSGDTVNQSAPVSVGTLTNVSAVAAGALHTCAIVSNRPYCWGYNKYGQLGNGTPSTASVGSLSPVEAGGATDSLQLTAGVANTYAVTSTGSIRSWGANESGQLGDGTTASQTTAALVAGITNATGVAAGMAHACALLKTGAVKCWGANFFGVLGIGGSTAPSLTPADVNGVSDASMISSRGSYTCAVEPSTSSLKCWGQLIDTNTSSSTPTTVQFLANPTAVSVGNSHVCALRSTGSIICWGRNDFGQLGDGTTVNSLTAAVGVVGL